MLPRTIWETISDVDYDSGSNFAWIVLPESDEERIIPLMRLLSGFLLNSVNRKPLTASNDNYDFVNVVQDDTVEGDVEVKEDPVEGDLDIKIGEQVNKTVPDFIWCMFPLPASYQEEASEDMKAVFLNLPLLNEFLPPPISPLLDRHQMRNNGEIGRAHV